MTELTQIIICIAMFVIPLIDLGIQWFLMYSVSGEDWIGET